MLAGALILLLMLLLVGAALFAFVCLMMARALLSPPRMVGGQALWMLRRLTPDDLGLPFEEIWFDVRDEKSGQKIDIAAWWISAAGARASDRCALIVHGYADSKIGGIAWAPVF